MAMQERLCLYSYTLMHFGLSFVGEWMSRSSISRLRTDLGSMANESLVYSFTIPRGSLSTFVCITMQ